MEHVNINGTMSNVFPTDEHTYTTHNPYKNVYGYHYYNCNDNYMFTGIEMICPFTNDLLRELEEKYKDSLVSIYSKIFILECLYNPSREIHQYYYDKYDIEKEDFINSIVNQGLVGWVDTMSSLVTYKYAKYVPLIQFMSDEDIRLEYESIILPPEPPVPPVQTIVDGKLYFDDVLMDDGIFTEKQLQLYVNDIAVTATGLYSPKHINDTLSVREYTFLFTDGILQGYQADPTEYNGRIYEYGIVTDKVPEPPEPPIPPAIQEVIDNVLYFDGVDVNNGVFTILDDGMGNVQLYCNSFPVTAMGYYSPFMVLTEDSTHDDDPYYYLFNSGLKDMSITEIFYNGNNYINGEKVYIPTQRIDENGSLIFTYQDGSEVNMDDGNFSKHAELNDVYERLYVNNILVTATGLYSPEFILHQIEPDPYYHLFTDGFLNTTDETITTYKGRMYQYGSYIGDAEPEINQKIINNNLYIDDILIDTETHFTIDESTGVMKLYLGDVEILAKGYFSPKHILNMPELPVYYYLFHDGTLATNENIVFMGKVYRLGKQTDEEPNPEQEIIDNVLYFDDIPIGEGSTYEMYSEQFGVRLIVDDVRVLARGYYSPGYTLINAPLPHPYQYLFNQGLWAQEEAYVEFQGRVYEYGNLTDKVPAGQYVQTIVDGKLYFDDVLMDNETFTIEKEAFEIQLYCNNTKVTAIGLYTPKHIVGVTTEYYYIFKNGQVALYEDYIEYQERVYERGVLTNKLPKFVPSVTMIEYLDSQLVDMYTSICNDISSLHTQLVSRENMNPIKRYSMYNTYCDTDPLYVSLQSKILEFYKMIAYVLSMYSVIQIDDFTDHTVRTDLLMYDALDFVRNTLVFDSDIKVLGDMNLLSYFTKNILQDGISHSTITDDTEKDYTVYSLEEFLTSLEQVKITDGTILQTHNNTITDMIQSFTHQTDLIDDEDSNARLEKLFELILSTTKVLTIITNIYSSREVIRKTETNGVLEDIPVSDLSTLITPDQYMIYRK